MKATKSIIKRIDILELILFVFGFIFIGFVIFKCLDQMKIEASRMNYHAVYSTRVEVPLTEIGNESTKVLEVNTLVDDRTPEERRMHDCVILCEIVGEEFDIDPKLIQAVVETESRYYPDIYGNGTVGLMQLIPYCHAATLNEYGYSFEDLTDPYINIRVGTKYLAYLVKKYDDIPFALTCYNKGEGGAFATGMRTSYYSDEVMKVYNRLKGGDIYGG